MKNQILLLSLIGLLSGCATLDNPCNPQGVGKCASVTDAYNASLKDTVMPTDLPNGQTVSGSASDEYPYDPDSASNILRAYRQQGVYSQVPQSGVAVRNQQQTMRIWILPYEDDVGLYHDQQYVYAVVKKATWRYKSTSLMGLNKSPYVNTAPIGQPAATNYQPFGPTKESDPIAKNQVLMSGNGLPPFSTQSVSNRNSSIINNTPVPTGN